MNELFLIQFLVLTLGVVLPGCATVRLLRFPRSSVNLPLWMLFVCLVPVAGPLVVLLVLSRQRPSVA